MGICPECQKQEMEVIGTEKFLNGANDNFAVGNKAYTIYTVWYCKKCNVLYLREPKTVFG